MKAILGLRRRDYTRKAGILLVVAALVVGLLGCDTSPVVRYDLTIDSTTGGSVTSPGEGSFTYDEGAMVDLVAESETGYQFVNWSGDVGTVGNVDAGPTTITMNGDYSITANFEEEDEVVFPDANLEAAVRMAIGKPTGAIYPSDLEGLTGLHASGRNITDLTGLEYCTDLIWLRLWTNQISDISPLAGLTSLTWLRLDSNQISDISPLAGLTSLTELDLSYNQISDISHLVDNIGLGEGDLVDLQWNPLSEDSINVYIPELEARGVTVNY